MTCSTSPSAATPSEDPVSDASGASTPFALQSSEGGYEACLTKAIQLCDHMHCMVRSRPLLPAATAAPNDHGAGSRLWASPFHKSSIYGKDTWALKFENRQVGRDFTSERSSGSDQMAMADRGIGKIRTTVLPCFGPRARERERRRARLRAPARASAARTQFLWTHVW